MVLGHALGAGVFRISLEAHQVDQRFFVVIGQDITLVVCLESPHFSSPGSANRGLANPPETRRGFEFNACTATVVAIQLLIYVLMLLYHFMTVNFFFMPQPMLRDALFYIIFFTHMPR
jgi:hypothetical protein